MSGKIKLTSFKKACIKSTATQFYNTKKGFKNEKL